MMKKFGSVLSLMTALAIIFCMFLMSTAVSFADESRMFDLAQCMSNQDAESLEEQFSEIAERQQFDIVAVIMEEGLSGNDLMYYCDHFFDDNGYGYGESRDGVIMVIDLRSRQYMLTTSGYGITAITDYGEETIYDSMQSDMFAGEFRSALEVYADTVDWMVDEARGGHPFDYRESSQGYEPGDSGYPEPAPNWGTKGGIAAFFGAIAGLFSSSKHKRKLKTVRNEYRANNYAVGGLHLTAQRERFLYRNVTATPKPKKTQSSSHGTTVHSSGGHSHGGGHGRGF